MLVCAILLVYGQTLGHDFVDFDDNDYVTRNPRVQAGLTGSSAAWAFTAIHSGNWHPLTWLSHMADCEVFGLNAGGHHLTNLLLHAANAALLYVLLRRLTASRGRSAFIAALFAVHPLHVESVAWISERKDVLSTFFGMLTMLTYAAYSRRPSVVRYGLVFSCLALGLMAKPMLVTAPVILLLLDYWPLNRFHEGSGRGLTIRQAAILVTEKLPLFALAAGSAAITLYAQTHSGAAPTLHELPLLYRVEHAAVAYAAYILKALWPANLAVFYPHPWTAPPLTALLGASLLLTIITIISVRMCRKRPYLLVGWLWYLITLLPVIGLIQVGGQALADRYMYVPVIGLWIMVAWGIPPRFERHPVVKKALAAGAVLLTVTAMALSWQVTGHWRNTETLFRRALAVTDDNAVAHNALGGALLTQGKTEEAIEHFTEALRIEPGHTDAHINIGKALAERKQYSEAILHYRTALQREPGRVEALNNLGAALAEEGKYEQAIEHYRHALRGNPEYAGAHVNLGNALLNLGNAAEAITHYSEARRLAPRNADALNGMGAALLLQNKAAEAKTFLFQAVELTPNEALYRLNLAVALRTLGDHPGAREQCAEALRLDPRFAKAIDFQKVLDAHADTVKSPAPR